MVMHITIIIVNISIMAMNITIIIVSISMVMNITIILHQAGGDSNASRVVALIDK